MFKPSLLSLSLTQAFDCLRDWTEPPKCCGKSTQHRVIKQMFKKQWSLTCICDTKLLWAYKRESLSCTQNSHQLCIFPKAGGKQLYVQASRIAPTNTGDGERKGGGYLVYTVPISLQVQSLACHTKCLSPCTSRLWDLYKELQDRCSNCPPAAVVSYLSLPKTLCADPRQGTRSFLHQRSGS